MPKLKEDKKTKHVLIKVTEGEYEAIKDKAKEYAGGNVSRWVRYAAINLHPKPEDLDGN